MYFPQNWINKLFSEENKVLRTPFEARRWQGPPPINKVEQDEIVLLFEVSLFTQFIQSWRQNELLSLVCLCIKKNPKKQWKPVSEDLLIKDSNFFLFKKMCLYFPHWIQENNFHCTELQITRHDSQC